VPSTSSDPTPKVARAALESVEDISDEAAVALVVSALNWSSPSSQMKAALFSEEPRSTIKPPSLDAFVELPAPELTFKMLSLMVTFVVSTVVVVPCTVRFPLRVKSAADRFPLKEALLPSAAKEPAWV